MPAHIVATLIGPLMAVVLCSACALAFDGLGLRRCAAICWAGAIAAVVLPIGFAAWAQLQQLDWLSLLQGINAAIRSATGG